MDMFKKITFVRFCYALASMLQEDLGLPTEKLICLYKECIEMAKHCNDMTIMMVSCMQFVEHSNSIGRHDDSLRCLKETLPLIEEISSYELIVHKYLSFTYAKLKEFESVVLHAKTWIKIAQNIDDKENEIDGHNEMGKAFTFLACYDDAIDCGKKCLEIAKEVDNIEGEMMAYDRLLFAYTCMQRYDGAILYAHKLIECALKTNDQKAMMAGYLNLEKAHLALNHFQEATDFGEKSLDIAREIQDRCGEAQAYLLMGQTYEALSDYDNSIIYCKKCIELAITIREKRAEAHAYSVLGSVYFSLGKYDDAIFNCNKCLYIEKEDNEEKAADANAYLTLGIVNESLKKYDEAIQNFKQCIDIVNRIGREKKVGANACLCLGEIYETLEQYNDAVYYSKKCINLAHEVGEKRSETKASLLLFTSCQMLGDKDDAIRYGKTCIELAQETGNKTTEAYACFHLSWLYQTLDEKDNAIEYGKKCIAISQKNEDKENEMAGHYILAQVYLDLLEVNSVSMSIDAGMAIAAELGHKDFKARFKEMRYTLHAAVGLLGKARDIPFVREYLEVPTCSEDNLLEDLAQAMKTNNQRRKYAASRRILRFYFSKKDYKKAINWLEQWKEMDVDSSEILYCFMHMGLSYHLMGQDDMALHCLEEGLPTAESHSSHMQRSRFYHCISELYILNRETNLAERYLREAIRYFEAIFTTLEGRDEFKISIFDQYIQSYKMLAILLINDERTEEALLVLDRGRARALMDLMITNFKMEQEESNDEQLKFSDALSLVSSNDFVICYYSLCFDAFLKFFLRDGAELPISIDSNAISPYDFLIYVDKLFDEMDLREVVNCEDRSFDKEQDIQQDQTRCFEDHKALTQATASLLNLDTTREESNDNIAETKGSTLEVLFDILGCDGILSSKQDEVVIIPEGPLYQVPFPALRDPSTGKYLSETKRIRLAPSLATLKHFEDFPTDRTSNGKPLIIGSPLVGSVMMDGEEEVIKPLFGALDEAIDIADLLGVSPLVAANATKPAVLERLRDGVSVVHIAAHGILSKATIVLAPSPEIRATKIPDEEDYMLTMADVQQAKVRAQLVVLSCCHSGRGEIRSEGVVGMRRAFLASGARAVVASLWAIDDDATLEFMKTFYAHLKSGNSASKSLYLVMSDMRQNERFNKPKYWAPFFLMGDDVTIKF